MDNSTINFRTVFKPVKSGLNIDYKSAMMFIGSCFTENIGELLKKSKFNVDINPFGILYNPISVKKTIDVLIEKKKLSENDVFYFNEQWHSFLHHSRFSDIKKEIMLEKVNQRIEQSSDFLKSSDLLFITFGTSWVYEEIKSETVVSNCHKIPAKNFKRRLLDLNEIVEELSTTLNKLKEYNNKMKVIFTISPVRHLKDGFSENNLSKSILRLAINKFVQEYEGCYYFPAYELLIDDLRDYRFYDVDMVHPNILAVDYIFDYFKKTFFNKETFMIYNEIMKINRAKNHRPFNDSSSEYKKFAEKNINLIQSITKKHGFIDFKDELSFFNNALMKNK